MVAGAGFELRVFFRNFIARFSISCLGIPHRRAASLKGTSPLP